MTAPGAPFAWSVVDIRGVPTRAYDSAPPSMALLWAGSVAHGDKDYIVYEDERLSYTEAHSLVDALCAHLASVGIGYGDRVAIAMRNYPEWVIGYWATVKVGAAVVGMNAWWTRPEMEFGLADCEATVLLCDRERLERIAPGLDVLREERRLHVVAVRTEGDLPDDAVHWDDALAATGEPPEPPAIDPEDDVCIFYTSGTTGHPKGAVLTHRGAVSNLLNLAFWQSMAGAAQEKAVAAGEAPPGSDKVQGESNPGSLLPVPLFHVTGCNCCLHPITAGGGRLVLMHRWNPERALELIERERCSSMSSVPTMARELINSPDFDKRDTSSLEHLGGGGAAVQPDLVTKIEERIQGRPSTGYGLTEVNGVVTINSAHFFLAKPESAGPVLPVMEARIVAEDGTDQPAGGLGELWVRGANVFRGYLNRPEANAEILTDGWFHTGDIGHRGPDGAFYVDDRKKDMIISGSENIYSAELEFVLAECADLAESTVVARPDERWGEVPVAVVVKLPDSEITKAEVLDLFADRLARYKHPKDVLFTDALPRNAMGKVLKFEVREMLRKG